MYKGMGSASRATHARLAKVPGSGDLRVRAPMPSDASSIPPHVSPRTGMHDLRNVLNAVQLNAFAARQLVDDGPRALACLARIEAAVQHGTDVLQAFPAEETLASAATVLRERLRDAGGDTDVSCAQGVDPNAHVPGLVRQALCLVAVECQARGASTFVLSVPHGDRDDCLQCEVLGLPAPGPVAVALASGGMPGFGLWMAPGLGRWTFRWTLRDPVPPPGDPA